MAGEHQEVLEVATQLLMDQAVVEPVFIPHPTQEDREETTVIMAEIQPDQTIPVAVAVAPEVRVQMLQ